MPWNLLHQCDNFIELEELKDLIGRPPREDTGHVAPVPQEELEPADVDS